MNDYAEVGYKVTEVRMYSETVYYDADGDEVDRETWLGDHLWDEGGRQSLTEFDVENYYG